jgi:hypothetical protein
LFIVGVVGTGIALGTLENIERQTKAGETGANAARDGAEAALLNAHWRLFAASRKAWLEALLQRGFYSSWAISCGNAARS